MSHRDHEAGHALFMSDKAPSMSGPQKIRGTSTAVQSRALRPAVMPRGGKKGSAAQAKTSASDVQHEGLIQFIKKRGAGKLELSDDELGRARTGKFADTLQLSHAIRSVEKTLGPDLAEVLSKQDSKQDLGKDLNAKVSELHQNLLYDWYLRLFSSLELPELVAAFAMESKTFQEMNRTFDPGVKGTEMRSEMLLDEQFVQRFWTEAAPKLAEKTLQAFRAKKSFTNAVSTGKFSQDVQLGSTATFYLGLDGVIGLPRLNFLEAMSEEHSSREPFDSFNQGTARKSSARDEFERVLPAGIEGAVNKLSYDGQTDCCQRWGCDSWESHPRVLQAKLLKAEIVALRLYTSPMYTQYNTQLRELLGKYLELRKEMGSAEDGIEDEEQTLLAAQKAMKLGGEGSFVTTIHSIASGLLKISRYSPEQGRVYRGIHGRNLPDCFLRPSRSGGRGGVEYGFLSTSKCKEEAIRYATAGAETEMPIIFEIMLGMVDRGADLEWITYFPGEQEICLPPLSNLELAGLPRYEWVQQLSEAELAAQRQGASSGAKSEGRMILVMTLPLQANVNFKGFTLDELEERRKALHVRAFENLLSEVIRDFRKTAKLKKAKAHLRDTVLGGAVGGRAGLPRANTLQQISAQKSVLKVVKWTEDILSECNQVLARHRDLDHHHYNNDTQYKEALDEALNTKVQAQRKLQALLHQQRVDRTSDNLQKIEDAPLESFTREAAYYSLLSGLTDFPWHEICERHASVRLVSLQTSNKEPLTPTQLRLVLQCLTAHSQAVEAISFGACTLKHSLALHSRRQTPSTPASAAPLVSATPRGEFKSARGSLLAGADSAIVSFGPLQVTPEEVDDGGEGDAVELAGQLLGEDGARLVGEVMAGCTRLTTLSLKDSRVFSAGSVHLATALQGAATSLTKLDLTHSSVGLRGGEHIASALHGATALRWLSLRCNPMSEQGWHRLAAALATTSSLTHLDLSCCALSPAPSLAVSTAIAALGELASLNLSGAVLSNDAASTIKGFLTASTSLTALNEEPVPRPLGAGIPGAKELTAQGESGVRVGFFPRTSAGTTVAPLQSGKTFNNQRDSEAVKQALKAGPEECLQLIERTPADEVDGRDEKGRTALLKACGQDQPVVVQALVLLNADVNAQDKEGHSAISTAARCGADFVVEILLAAKADPHVACRKKQNPLHQAALNAPENSTSSLFAHLEGDDVRHEVNAVCSEGLTPLHYAARQNKPGVIGRLLKLKADVNKRSEGGEMTALAEAAKAGHLAAMEKLIEAGASLDEKSKAQRTPIMQAAAANKADAVRLLIDRRAALTGTDSQGKSLLAIARSLPSREVVDVLLDAMPLAREQSAESVDLVLAGSCSADDDDDDPGDLPARRVAARVVASPRARPTRLGAAPPPPPAQSPTARPASWGGAAASAGEGAVEPGMNPFPPLNLPWLEEMGIQLPPPFWVPETEERRTGEEPAPVQCAVM